MTQKYHEVAKSCSCHLHRIDIGSEKLDFLDVRQVKWLLCTSPYFSNDPEFRTNFLQFIFYVGPTDAVLLPHLPEE